MRYSSPAALHGYFLLTSKYNSLLTVTNIHQTQWIAPTTQSAWKEHVRGLEALINNYGPAAFHQEPMRQVFEQARMHIVRFLTL